MAAAAIVIETLIAALAVIVTGLVFLGGVELDVLGQPVSVRNTQNPMLALLLLLLLRRALGPWDRPRFFVAWLRERAGQLVDWLRADARRSRRLTAVAASSYAVLMSVVVVFRHRSLNSHAFDLGIFDQVLWGIANGLGTMCSIRGDIDYFGDHIVLFLYPLSSLYRLGGGVEALLVFQTLALAAGGLLVHAIARRALGSDLVAAGFALLYFAYAPVRNSNLYGFHPIVLATPWILAILWAHDARRWALFALLCVTSFALKEEMGFVIAAIGIVTAVRSRKLVLGGSLAAAGVAWTLLCVSVLIPHFKGAPSGHAARYAYLGDSLGEMILSILTRPDLVIPHLMDPDKLRYLVDVFGPVLFVPFAAPVALLMAGPTLAQNLLTEFPLQYSIGFHYTGPLTPIVFYSAIWGVANLRRLADPSVPPPRLLARLRLSPRILARLRPPPPVAYLLAVVLLFGWSPATQLRQYRPTEIDDAIRAELSGIEPQVAVSAQGNLVPHLSHRPLVREFPAIHDCELIILAPGRKTFPLSKEEYAARLENLASNERYRRRSSVDGLLVYETDPAAP